MQLFLGPNKLLFICAFASKFVHRHYVKLYTALSSNSEHKGTIHRLSELQDNLGWKGHGGSLVHSPAPYRLSCGDRTGLARLCLSVSRGTTSQGTFSSAGMSSWSSSFSLCVLIRNLSNFNSCPPNSVTELDAKLARSEIFNLSNFAIAIQFRRILFHPYSISPHTLPEIPCMPFHRTRGNRVKMEGCGSTLCLGNRQKISGTSVPSQIYDHASVFIQHFKMYSLTFFLSSCVRFFMQIMYFLNMLLPEIRHCL